MCSGGDIVMIRGARCGGRSARSATTRSVVVAIGGVFLIAACGSGALEGPDSRSSGSSARESSERPGSSASAGPDQPGGPVTYSYSLPEGDTSHADENGVMYWHLTSGNCAQAQAHLDYSWPWGFQSPEEVLMFQVGTSMCAGDVATAAAQFDRGESRYGWAGLATFGRNLCNIYRAYLSYREQEPQDAISCPGGGLVYWPGWPDPQPRDDPRTTVVEAESPDSPGSAYTEEPPEPAPEETSSPETSPSLPGEPADTTEPPAGTSEPESTPAPDQAP